jgi:hypothetical protein
MKKKLALKTQLFLLLLFCVVAASLGLWFAFSSKNHCAIPIQFPGGFHFAYVDAEIEGKHYFLELDTGCNFSLVLVEEVLEKIQKEPLGTVTSRDRKGNQYETQRYLLKKVKMGKATFTNIQVKEESKEFRRNGVYGPPRKTKVSMETALQKKKCSKKISERLGLGTFLGPKIPALFLDLGNSA